MARMEVKSDAYDEFDMVLNKSEQAAKRALYEGAKVIADGLRSAVNALPEERYVYKPNDTQNVISPTLKAALADSIGIAKFTIANGNIETVVGFSGYASEEVPSKKYPKGLPLPMIARSIEVGSSARRKNPFVRRNAEQHKQDALDAMAAAGEQVLNNKNGE